jgi:hypothetical protein
MIGLFDRGMQKDALLDPTGAYRFLLSRVWDTDRARVCWIMLNPSKADARRDDNTIRQCISFSKSWAFGSLEVVNLFALISTDPAMLRGAHDPVGEGNDNYIREAAGRARKIVCAWGAGGALFGRSREVIDLCRPLGKLWCIGTTKTGHPWHPLRKSLELPLIPFEG